MCHYHPGACVFVFGCRVIDGGIGIDFVTKKDGDEYLFDKKKLRRTRHKRILLGNDLGALSSISLSSRLSVDELAVTTAMSFSLEEIQSSVSSVATTSASRSLSRGLTVFRRTIQNRKIKRATKEE